MKKVTHIDSEIRRYRNALRAAKRAVMRREDWFGARYRDIAYEILREASKRLDLFGVEGLWAGWDLDRIKPEALFIEAGDLYALTILWDSDTNKYRITDMGSWRRDQSSRGRSIAY